MDIAATAKRILAILHPEQLATQFRKLTGMAKRGVASASHSGLIELEHATPLDAARQHSLRMEAELTGRPIVPDPKPISQMSPLEFAQQNSLRMEAELAATRANPSPPAMPADGIRSATPAIAQTGRHIGG